MTITRRELSTALLATALTVPVLGREAAKSPGSDSQLEWSKVRGFNYHPSYATNLIEIWSRFDAKTIETELIRGKRFFPRLNALRWWHSWDAFNRDPLRYVENFRTVLALSEQIGCRVIPVLFNRTHLPPLDFGSIYIDHFLPGSILNRPGMFDAYLDAVVGGSSADRRILAWDLCNEPYWYFTQADNDRLGKTLPVVHESIPEAEDAWIRSIYARCKSLGVKAPLTVVAWGDGHVPLSRVNPVSDVLSIHFYYQPKLAGGATPSALERQLDEQVAFARAAGKPLFVSECCWGNVVDAERARDSRYELQQIHQRGLGFLAFVMQESRMPDSHGPSLGPVGIPGDLSFIRADGRLRAGHEFFNEF
jgi:hypothetical protein